MIKRMTASVVIALMLGLGAVNEAEAGATKSFVSYKYGNAKAKCQAFKTQLLRDGYVVTQNCTYTVWDWPAAPPQHAFLLSWRT